MALNLLIYNAKFIFYLQPFERQLLRQLQMHLLHQEGLCASKDVLSRLRAKAACCKGAWQGAQAKGCSDVQAVRKRVHNVRIARKQRRGVLLEGVL